MIISWNTTRQCHLKCKHCYRDAGAKESDELTTKEGKGLIEEIAKAGFKILVLSGGEPLLRKDIYELTNYAASRGLRPVFGTTGTTITPPVALKLKISGASRIGISLDSVSCEMYNQFRGVSGSWEKAVQGMKNCLEADLPFQIHTTVVEQNYHEVEAITDLAVSLGAAAHHLFFMVPTGRAVNIEEEAIREKNKNCYCTVSLKNNRKYLLN